MKKPFNAYQLARQAESDDTRPLKISNGSVKRVLDRLTATGYIRRDPENYFRITPTGKLILDWEIDRYQNLIDLGKIRRRNNQD